MFFQPKEGALEEDDGYMMAYVYNWKSNTSQFVMWDARNLSDTPILRIQLKNRVPNGFHSLFVTEKELE